MKTCPCGNQISYSNCCELIHQNISVANNAEELMRSRYTAFVKANGKFLKESHHLTTRPQTKKALQEIVDFSKSVKWLGLEIIETKLGQQYDEDGTVEFKAHFNYQNKRDLIHEVSSFRKENGIWYYFDAIK